MTRRRADLAVLDAFGDPLNRDMLLLASEAPVSAKEFAARLDVTPPTVYRRTDRLVEHDLLAVNRCVDHEGNHYRTFETRLERLDLRLDEAGYSVDLTFRGSLSDAFEGWWTDLDQTDDMPIGAAEGLDRASHHDSSPS